jgi:glutathione S-transferase
MKLLGHYLSPYTRRVAVSLNTLGMTFTLEELSVMKEPERVRPHNPLLRIPTLVLDDGTALIESGAILDEIDQMAGPARALVPPAGPERRRVTQLTAFAIASMEKQQWASYERRFRPAEKVHQPWIDHNEGQSLGGFRHLDRIAAEASGWLAGTQRMTQADITTAVIVGFAVLVRPELNDLVPNLCAFAARCEQLPAFRNAPMPASQPGRPGVWIGSDYDRVAEARTQESPPRP